MSDIKKNLEAKLQAFTYQEDAVNYLVNKEYGAIFHEQGLGKSKIAVDLILEWLKKDELDYIILVAKKGLVNNWIKEVKNHTYLKHRIIDNDVTKNTKAFTSLCNLIITHYEAVKLERKRITSLCETERVGIILDESTKIKNPESSLSKIFHELSLLFKKRLILTGTPIANRPYDIWSQIYFLDQGKSLGEDFNDFKKQHDLSKELTGVLSTKEENNYKSDHNAFNSNSTDMKQKEFESRIRDIKNKIVSFSVRENKSNEFVKNKLPEKIFKKIKCDWESKQKQLYLKYKKELGATILKNGKEYEDDSEDLIKLLLRLVQIASNPSLVDESYNVTSGKEIILDDLLLKIFKQNEKVIVWSNFTNNINYLYNKYKSFFPVRIHGKLSMDERNRAVELFLNNNECKVLFATPGAAKEGLTLTVANHAIFYDRGFSLDDYLQSQDRIHRISQKKDCFIYNLIMDDSIDKWIDELLNTKKYAALLAQGDIDINEYRSNVNYSFGEILNEVLNG